MATDNNLSKLTNANQSFEGAAIPPQVKEGFRVPAVSNLKIVTQQDKIGGSLFTLVWNQEGTSTKSLYYVLAWTGDNIIKWSTAQNKQDQALKGISRNIQGPFLVFGSPATVFIQADQKMPVFFTVMTRTPGGIISELAALPGVSGVVNPIIPSYLIDYQKDATEITGNSADQTLYSTTIPGGTLVAGGGIKVAWGFRHTTGASGVTYKLFYGTGSTNIYAGSADAGSWVGEAHIMNIPGSLVSQRMIFSDSVFVQTAGSFAPDGTDANFSTTLSQDSTINQTLKITFNVANTNGVTPRWWIVTKL